MSTTSLLKDVVYKDLDIGFTENPNTKDVGFLTNDKAITRAIKNLVFTNSYERPYKPKIASDVMRSLFENFTPVSSSILAQRIRDVIVNYEPRARLIDVKVEERIDEHDLRVYIIYRPLNAKDPVTIELFLERIR